MIDLLMHPVYHGAPSNATSYRIFSALFSINPKDEKRGFWGSGLWPRGWLLRKRRGNHRGKREKVHREPEVEHRRYRMMACPACSKEMIKGTVISSGSMPFGVNVIFRPTEKATNRPPHIILEKNAKAYYCESCNRVFAIYDAK